MTERERLLTVLDRARSYLLLADNDFSWSSWESEAEAVSELDDHVARIRADEPPDVPTLEMFFAPTGPIQEVSLSSGWGEPFLALARDFDNAIRPFAPRRERIGRLGILGRLVLSLFRRRA